MTRAALLLLPAAALLAFAAAQHAEARSKAFCRDYAQAVADRDFSPNASEAVTQAAPGVTVVGAVAEGQPEGDASMPAAGTGNAVLTDAPAGGRWEDAYHHAYTECRAS